MIPQAVKRGSNALFTCNYDMENDTLYSVKWYKGKREFYRYTPKENPAMKVFAMTSGLNVEVSIQDKDKDREKEMEGCSLSRGVEWLCACHIH